MTRFLGFRIYLTQQTVFCRDSGSPFSALVLERMGDRLGEGGPFDAVLAQWADATSKQVLADAAPLRLLGAFHYLALSGRSPRLGALYPSETAAGLPDGSVLAEAMAEALGDHPGVVSDFMASAPQTNEVGRSLALVGGFLTVAAETGLPLRCLELGASAGLNMNWDRFGYRFGDGSQWGDPHSPVQLSGDWTGPAPPTVEIRVVERQGCDVNPVDVRDPVQALRLQSYVWAGQTLRMQRLRGAIAVKLETGGAPDRVDAGDWTLTHAHPEAGVATVVYHSVFLQYPPKATQEKILDAIAAAGARATDRAPFAWLRMEPDPDDLAASMQIRLTLWPGGRKRVLARVHPHGAKVEWLEGRWRP